MKKAFLFMVIFTLLFSSNLLSQGKPLCSIIFAHPWADADYNWNKEYGNWELLLIDDIGGTCGDKKIICIESFSDFIPKCVVNDTVLVCVRSTKPFISPCYISTFYT